MDSNNVIIIGSGVAGMAAGIRLAVQGHNVIIYEKNTYPGGKLSLIEKEGYRFDAGPSLFTEPANLEELFELADEPIENYFTYSKVPSGCSYFFENRKTINTWTSHDELVQEFVDKLGEPREEIIKYLQESEKAYNEIGYIFLNYPIHKSRTWRKKNVLKAFLSAPPALLFQSLNSYNESRFKSVEAVQLFNRFATYNGSDPYRAPAMLSLVSHVELNKGVYYPAGGMISITNALYKLAIKKGVKFIFESPVQRIIYTDSRAIGIVVDHRNIFADIIISNVDVHFTYQTLLSNTHKAAAIAKKEKSSSAIVFYWGIKKRFPQLQLHNIFFSNNYRAEFAHIFRKKTVYADPTIYVNITAKMEAAHAPEGSENWFVMVNAPSGIYHDSTKMTAFVKKQVLKKLRAILKQDIEPFIETEEILDPAMLERNTGAYDGSLYGMSSNTKWSAFLRHPNFSNKIKGLYFCGGTVHPGGGIPLCLKSAKIVAELVKKDHFFL